MNKIICDICGTVFPDSAPICPICGYPAENSKLAAEEHEAGAAAAAAATRAPVKGGRFSHKNTKKRIQASGTEEHRNRQPERKQEDPAKPDRGLVITAVVLILANLLVIGYIGWRFWKGRDAYDNPATPVLTDPVATDPVDTEPVETSVPCVGITISDASVTLTEAGKAWKLDITRSPEDTTDELVITSSDESVVTVTQDGLVTAVGPGNATITITCGAVIRTCQVSCSFAPETEPPVTTQPVETTEPEETTKPTEETKPAQTGLVISHTDVTLFKAGESFRITVKYNGETLSPAQVSFTSKDDTVATVEANGQVTGVGGGTTTITVSYNGETAKCVVRCKIEEAPTEEPENTENTEPTEDTEPTESGWEISHTDVTIRVGESFTLRLRNAAGETADVAWSVSESGIVEVSGNKITGLTDGRVRISATIDGVTYTCIVRVKA